MSDKETIQKKATLISDNIKNVIVGKLDVSDMILTALIARGHVLLEDVPGTGKTMIAKSFAKSIDAAFSRIQFTPDLLPSDITGINYYNQKMGDFTFRKGPIFSNIVLADEINRATPRTQSALLECMEERQVTVDGESYPLNMPFIVIATQNLIETAGTYQLPEAQLDRFLLKISMGYPDKQEELAILNRFKGSNPFDTLKNVCDGQDIQKMCAEAKNVFVHESIMNYIIDIVVKTREHENIAIGVSPRGTLNMVNAVRAYAYIKGRQYVTPEDVKKLAVSVFAHRLVLKHGMTRQDNRQTIIKDILDTVVVPTEDWLK
ncbi:MAG: MoxR family ATPase [Lachnospira sp.]|nr:MoxR family ATPase [Lachnospira sp.]